MENDKGIAGGSFGETLDGLTDNERASRDRVAGRGEGGGVAGRDTVGSRGEGSSGVADSGRVSGGGMSDHAGGTVVDGGCSGGAGRGDDRSRDDDCDRGARHGGSSAGGAGRPAAIDLGDPAAALEVMRRRHSVRQYTSRPIDLETRKELMDEVARLNFESGLNMQLLFDEPMCFQSAAARYGKFTGVSNYLAIVGPKTADLDERAGYYGEKFVIFAQSLGVNSCWVGMTHGRSQAHVSRGERLAIVVSLGYGERQGFAHKSKPIEQLCSVTDTAGNPAPAPAWFRAGMEGAMLAPTAVNQQKFLICYDGTHLTARLNGRGFFDKVDLGIVKCDFELASGHKFDE